MLLPLIKSYERGTGVRWEAGSGIPTKVGATRVHLLESSLVLFNFLILFIGLEGERGKER